METVTIDRLFLELSQVTKASTAKELVLMKQVSELVIAIRPFVELIEATNGRIPAERLSAADWHSLVKAYRSITPAA